MVSQLASAIAASFTITGFAWEGRICFDLFVALHATARGVVQHLTHKLYIAASLPATLRLVAVLVVPIKIIGCHRFWTRQFSRCPVCGPFPSGLTQFYFK
jgi:hypothetical protein